MSHTPGPWEARTSKVASNFVAAVPHPGMGIVIAVMMRGGQAELPDEELAANARLIAAAPDLLAVLQRIVAGDDLQKGDVEWHEARAAIAKATGEAS